MDEKKTKTSASEDIEICCCPICASEEFLLSDNNDTLICVNCGPVHLQVQVCQPDINNQAINTCRKPSSRLH